MRWLGLHVGCIYLAVVLGRLLEASDGQEATMLDTGRGAHIPCMYLLPPGEGENGGGRCRVVMVTTEDLEVRFLLQGLAKK